MKSDLLNHLIKNKGLVLLLGAMAISGVIRHNCIGIRTAHRSISDIQFKSRSPDSSFSSIKEFSEWHSGDLVEMSVSGRFKPHGTAGYPNLFQTASGNSGVRLEVCESTSRLILVMGSRAPLGNSVLSLAASVSLDQWHEFWIRIDRTGDVTAFLDGHIVADQRVPELNIRMSDIAIGTGFDKQRRFDGEIANFKMVYTMWSHARFFRSIFGYLTLGLGFIFLVLLNNRYNRITIRGLRSAGVRFSKGSTRLLWAFVSGMSRLEKIEQISMLLTFNFIAIVVYLYVVGMFWNKAWPYNSFLPHPLNRFCDFYSIDDLWIRFKFNGEGIYFPGAYLLLNLFTSFWPNPYTAVNVLLWIMGGFVSLYCYFNLKSRSLSRSLQDTAVFGFMSYPVLFTLHTANFESFVFICLGLFIYLYRKRNPMAVVFLAYAISMKLIPAFFLLLLLSDRRYREIGLTCFWVVVFTLTPLLIFKGGLLDGWSNYWTHMKVGQKFYMNFMVLGSPGIYYGHSLLGCARILFIRTIPPIITLLKPYTAFVLVSLAGISYLVIFKIHEFWKRVALIVMSLNLFPYVSTDYKLLHIYIPLFLFINSARQESLDRVYAVLFAILLMPKYYAYLYESPLLSLNNILNTFTMLTILLVIICSPSSYRSSAVKATSHDARFSE